MRNRKKRKLQGANSLPSPKSTKSDKAFSSLVGLLAKRDHSELELKKKLSTWYTPEAVTEALKKAHEYGYIRNPEELAAAYTAALHRKEKGMFYIQKKLKEKGLPLQSFNKELELTKCLQLLQKKYGQETLKSTEERAKAYRYLTTRGFDIETIKKAIAK